MRRQHQLGLNDLGQHEPVKQREHIRANRRALRRIAHRKAPGTQDRALERINGTDVRFVSTSPDEDPKPNLPKHDAYGWIDPALLPQAVPCWWKHNREIGKLAALQARGDGA